MPRLPLIVVLAMALVGCTNGDATIAGAERSTDEASGHPRADERAPSLPGFETDTSKRSIELHELVDGGPPKDGIPALTDPELQSIDQAERWLNAMDPVIVVGMPEHATAYPLALLAWHEIINHTVGEVPIAVTWCPLCDSAVVFDRRVGDRTLTFAVSGKLRNSDMIMYDRETESLWQQLQGRAVVGQFTGTELDALPMQLIDFHSFAEAYPFGNVVSHDTGAERPYGRNPYEGYDRRDSPPYRRFFEGETDPRLPPKTRLTTIETADGHLAVPRPLMAERRVLHLQLDERDVVLFHGGEMASALDALQISDGRRIGATTVFETRLGDREMEFSYDEQEHVFRDAQTGSTWSLTGHATSGPLEGEQLTPVESGNHFAFAWLRFHPDTRIIDR